MTINTNPAIDVIREGWDDGDKWGSALTAQFDVAETLTRYGAHVPDEWEYSPGLSVSGPLSLDDASWEQLELDNLMRQGYETQIRHAGEVMRRLVHIYELEGLSY